MAQGRTAACLNHGLTRLQFRRKREGTGDESDGGRTECKGGLGEGGRKRERCGGTEIRSVQKSILVRMRQAEVGCITGISRV